MFGLRYDTRCPYCNGVYEADHGITSYFKRKGLEDLGEYIEEHCRICGTTYYSLCVTEDKAGYIDIKDMFLRLDEVNNDDLIVSRVICW